MKILKGKDAPWEIDQGKLHVFSARAPAGVAAGIIALIYWIQRRLNERTY